MPWVPLNWALASSQSEPLARSTYLAATVALSDLVHRIKGGSAYDVNHHLRSPRPLLWQAGYWAESVGPADLDPLIAYVRGQRLHHDPSHPAERWQFGDEPQ